jgi:predicted HicB family RNase H-like nuclease
MARQPAYSPGPDIPQDEILRNRQGRVVDDAYTEEAAAEAIAAVRGRGRPSLSRSGESPLLRVRLSRELDDAVTRAAEQAGTSRADWIRHALAQAARKAS